MKEPQWLTDAIEKARADGLIISEQFVAAADIEAASPITVGGGQEAALPQIPGARNLPAGPPVFEASLPYPPSVNHYLRYGPAVSRKTGKQYLAKFITKKGKDYRARVCRQARKIRRETLTGPLAIEITTHPPDGLRRDIDNTLKCLLDALQHAGVYEDDNQIADLRVRRGKQQTGGSVDVSIRQIALPQPSLW